jgi:hypothetical protein
VLGRKSGGVQVREGWPAEMVNADLGPLRFDEA